MNERITLGSLFNGIGGFPLSGTMCGVEPVWASEIEPFPIAVTMNRFPNMKHLGSVTDIRGDQIEPVDIITFGSPCQDLSVAGKQAGIHDGARSNLFFEAVRIIKEMREHDRSTGRTGFDVRPRFAVWENVPGAFSSGKGKDFQAVLQTLCEVADPNVTVPLPEKGKWNKSGHIVGDGYSIAWRVYDAQYWGVPQRRKRIYLIADFASERAGEILFESEGVSGHPETSREAREGTAGHAEGSAGRSGGVKCLNPWDVQSKRQYDISGVYRTLDSGNAAGGQAHGICYPSASFMGGQGSKAGGIGYKRKVSPTLKSVLSGSNTIPEVVHPTIAIEGNGQRESHQGNGYVESDQMYTLNTVEKHAVCYGISSYASNAMKSSNPHSGIYEAKTSRTLDLNAGNPTCNQGGMAIVQSYQKVVGALCMDDYKGSNRQYVDQDKVVVSIYDCRGNGTGGVTPTLTGDHQNRVTDYTALAVCAGNGQLHNATMKPVANALDCMHDQQAVVTDGKPPRRYIVRRLTPLECCRLQGYPDGWTENISFDALSQEQVDQLEPIRKTWAEVNGKNYKPCKDRAALEKWFNGLQTDSAEYKAYGNSLAIPCSYDVIRRVANAIKEAKTE